MLARGHVPLDGEQAHVATGALGLGAQVHARDEQAVGILRSEDSLEDQEAVVERW